MTQINFYKLSGNFDAALVLACRLTEKAYQQNLPVLLHTPDEAASRQLDELLWSFKPSAFLPHAIETVPASAIAISHTDDPGEHHGILINLSRSAPSWFSRFEKAIEIVYDDQQIIDEKRERWSFLKSRGYPMQYHDLTKPE